MAPAPALSDQTADGDPPSVAPFVRAIGAEPAAELFLRFGGRAVYLSARPRPGSALVAAIGTEAASALLRAFGRGHVRVPMGKAWIARRLDAAGVPRAEIAERLRVSSESVRSYLAAPRREAA